jgi:predicted transcriptional regulator
MWENYYAEKNPIHKVKILESITEMQQYLSAYYDATGDVLMQSIKSIADLKGPPDTYVSVDLRHFREKEIVQDRAKGKLFNPYKKDIDPYETTAQSNPHKQISEEEIQENSKKMKKKSNLKDFDSTQKDNSNNNLESASWD